MRSNLNINFGQSNLINQNSNNNNNLNISKLCFNECGENGDCRLVSFPQTAEFYSEPHVIASHLAEQFNFLSLIRLKPAMPRLCIIPGKLCSAPDIKSAKFIVNQDRFEMFQTNQSQEKTMYGIWNETGVTKFVAPPTNKRSNRITALVSLQIILILNPPFFF